MLKKTIIGTWVTFILSFFLWITSVAVSNNFGFIVALGFWVVFSGIITLVITFNDDARHEVQRILESDDV